MLKFLFVLVCFIGLFHPIMSVKNNDPMPGAPIEQDTNDEDMKKEAIKVVNEYNKKSNSENQYVLVKIISAKSQVVAGVLYKFELEVAEAENCKKGDVCTNPKTGATKKISGSVLSRPWMKDEEDNVSVKEI